MESSQTPFDLYTPKSAPESNGSKSIFTISFGAKRSSPATPETPLTRSQNLHTDHRSASKLCFSASGFCAIHQFTDARLIYSFCFLSFMSFTMGSADNPANDKADHLPGEANVLVNDKTDRLPREAEDLLKALASEWDDVLDANALQVIPLKGAMTNVVFQIKWPTKTRETSRKVLVRIYGEGVDVFFDRDNEIQTFEFMSKHGQGPRLLGRFANGRIEEFIHARTLSASDLRNSDISSLIAAKMKEFHDLDMPGPKKVDLWDRLRKWLSVAKHLSSPEEAKAFNLDAIEEEISILEKELSRNHQKIGFCHNDLQYGNIMLDEETNSVTIIDYEYASYNPVAYDIANHFCEMAADYHTDTPHILDYSKYPDLEERKKFVDVCLSSSGDKPSDNEVEQLLQDVQKYTLANHLFWGVWGIISGHVNKIDFDYMEYARQRFQQYWTTKPSLLGSIGPSPDKSVTGSNTVGLLVDGVTDYNKI